MAETNSNGDDGQEAKSPTPPPDTYKDTDGNEITLAGKRWAGLILILFTLLSALYIVGHWPDRLVGPREPVKPLYTYEWFNVRLVGIPDTGLVHYLNDTTLIAEKSGLVKTNSSLKDTATITDSIRKDSVLLKSITKANDSIKKLRAANITEPQKLYMGKRYPPENTLMHINTLLLILVGMAGFLGNMIHVSTSFTTFLGNGQFKKSWALWYIIKPFTAAALSIGLYFVFRGGFLNMSDDSSNINIYGAMTISLLAGLFTDRTTLKLKEVFDVLLRPNEKRSDPLIDDKLQITNVNSEALEVGKDTLITISGKNLDKNSPTIKIEGQEITNINKQPTEITFTFTLTNELKDKQSLKLEIVDNKGNALFPPKQLNIKKASNSLENAADLNVNRSPDNHEKTVDNAKINQDEFGDPDSEDEINKPQD